METAKVTIMHRESDFLKPRESLGETPVRPSATGDTSYTRGQAEIMIFVSETRQAVFVPVLRVRFMFRQHVGSRAGDRAAFLLRLNALAALMRTSSLSLLLFKAS